MPHERFFVEEPFQENATIHIVDPQEIHHLQKVMRCHVGDLIELVNGKNVLAKGKIEAISSKQVSVKLTYLETEISKGPKLILAQAIPRFARLEYILEKGTELGADQFWLFPGDLSEKGEFSPNQKRRMELILQGAMKQCGRLSLPSISLKPPLSKWEPIPEGSLFFGDLAGAPLSTTLSENKAAYLFIGPEKGWSFQEKTLLLNTLKAKSICFHPNILRTDTAAITGLSLLFNRLHIN